MKMSIPAYYKDKKGREEKTAQLETIIGQILETVVAGGKDHNPNDLFMSLFSIEFEPKFLDDTRFVVVSRYHAAITAMEIWREKLARGEDCPLMYISTLDVVTKFIANQYLPMCDDLLGSVLHKYSNHGALALMGKVIALKFLANIIPSYKNQLQKCRDLFEDRVDFAILDKKCFWGNSGEFWVENLRNKKGLYYTYLHLSALIRTLVSLMNAGIKVDEDVMEDLHEASMRYSQYFHEPETWPYRDRTKIPVLRQLQGLIFPADEFIEPRIFGKEGAFMDVLANRIYPVSMPPFCTGHTYKELSPFPYSSILFRDNLWQIL